MRCGMCSLQVVQFSTPPDRCGFRGTKSQERSTHSNRKTQSQDDRSVACLCMCCGMCLRPLGSRASSMEQPRKCGGGPHTTDKKGGSFVKGQHRPQHSSAQHSSTAAGNKATRQQGSTAARQQHGNDNTATRQDGRTAARQHVGVRREPPSGVR
jgi:hypothetical protein